MTLEVDTAVEASGWDELGPLEDEVDRWAGAAAAEAGFTADATVSVLLTDDAAVRTMNRTWRGQDKPTNVLSFPAGGPPPPDGPRPLGDIAVAFETTAAEARRDAVELRAHLAHLVVHGTLHLLGYDHETSAEAETMEAAERRALSRLGFADPYAGTEPVAKADA